MTEKSFMTVEEVAAELRVSKSKAYQIVRELNAEMQKQGYGSDIIGLNQKEPNSKGDAEFSPVLILLLGGIECKERKLLIWNRASQERRLNQ